MLHILLFNMMHFLLLFFVATVYRSFLRASGVVTYVCGMLKYANISSHLTRVSDTKDNTYPQLGGIPQSLCSPAPQILTPT